MVNKKLNSANNTMRQKSASSWNPLIWSWKKRILFFLLILIGYLIANNYVQNYRSVAFDKRLINDARALKAELERELGIELREDNRCSQNQGKYDDENSAWGCSVVISSDDNYLYDRARVESVVSRQKYLINSFENTDNGSGKGYYYRKDPGPTCGTGYSNGFSVGCSFSVENSKIKEFKKILGLMD